MQAVRQEAERIHRDHALEGKPFLSYRITQLYASGACVYFTYAASLKGSDDPGAIAGSAEHRLRRAIMQSGGAVSNHHGVGKRRSKALASVLPPLNAEVIRGVKAVVDPGNVFGARNGVFCQGFRPSSAAEHGEEQPPGRFDSRANGEMKEAEPQRGA